MYVLGISFNCYNPSACLLKDNSIIAFVEEERLNRIKNAAKSFPILSIKYCMEQGNIQLNDIAYIAYGFDVNNYDNGNMRTFYDSIEFEKDHWRFQNNHVSLVCNTFILDLLKDILFERSENDTKDTGGVLYRNGDTILLCLGSSSGNWNRR